MLCILSFLALHGNGSTVARPMIRAFDRSCSMHLIHLVDNLNHTCDDAFRAANGRQDEQDLQDGCCRSAVCAMLAPELKSFRTEIEQEANVDPRRREIVDQLNFVDGM